MNEQKTLRVGIWCAVSSEQQAGEDRISLQEQEKLGRQYAERHGWPVVAVYRVAHSRKTWSWQEAERDMDAYRRLREDAEAGRFDVLHALGMDRLGRDQALSQQVLSLLEANGQRCYLHKAPMDVTSELTDGHRYLTAIQGAAAKAEVVELTRRLRIGMGNRVKRGLFAHTPPTGYRIVRDEFGNMIGAEFDENIGAVRLVTEQYLTGASYAEMREALASSGYKPPGEAWFISTLRYWMKNDAYAGYPDWAGVQADEPSPYYPALWDAKTFAAILRERERRRTLRPRKNSTPLLGIALCGHCGYRMHRTGGYREQHYLRCGQHAQSKMPDHSNEPCHPNYIKERIVIETLIEFLARVMDLDALNEAMIPDTDSGRAEMRINEINSALDEYAMQRKRLALALAAGQMEGRIYSEADGEILSRVSQLQAERAQLVRRRVQRVAPDVRLRSLENVRELLQRGLKTADPQEINVLLHEAGVRIHIEDGEVTRVGIYESPSL